MPKRSRPSMPDRLSEFERLCRDNGLALTVQRRIIFSALAERGDHPTADEVLDGVRSRLPGVSRTTVYRVLETLVRAGVITKACHPGAAARYDPLTHRHHHIVCLYCEKVLDLEDPRLNRLPMPRRSDGFEINDYCIHFRGICGACRRKTQHKTGDSARRSRGQTSNRPRGADKKKGRNQP